MRRDRTRDPFEDMLPGGGDEISTIEAANVQPSEGPVAVVEVQEEARPMSDAQVQKDLQEDEPATRGPRKRRQNGSGTASGRKSVSETGSDGIRATKDEMAIVPPPLGNEKVFVELPADLVVRMRRIIYWDRLPSKKSFIEEALLEKVQKAEKVNGGTYEPTPDELRDYLKRAEQLGRQ